MIRSSLFPVAALLSLGSGCGPGHDDTPNPAPIAPARFDLCADAVVPNGFGLAWQNNNHRISRWGLHLDASMAESCTASGGARLLAEYIGGDWTTGQSSTDTPIASVDYVVVAPRRPGASAPRGPFGISRAATELAIDPSQHASAIAKRPAVEGFRVEVLTGLLLDTDVPQGPDYPSDYDPAHGYTSRGFAASVSDRADGDVDVAVSFLHGPADRKPMNAAIPFARTRAVVRHATVQVQGGVMTRATRVLHLVYEQQKALDTTPLPHGSDAKLLTEIVGQRGFEHGVVLLTGMRFSLFPALATGDYVRELSVHPRSVSYDPSRGAARLLLDGYASNSGFITMAGMDAEMAFDLVLVQWNGGGAPEQVAFEQAFDTGAAAFTLPMER